MKASNFSSLALLLLISVGAAPAVQARGGWDGNGLSVSGMAQDTPTARAAQFAGKTAVAAGQGPTVRYVELPAAAATPTQRRLTR